MGSWIFGANQTTSAMGPFKHLTILAALATTIVYALPGEQREKAIGIFNIVQFPNDLCVSSNANQNGTCYTSEECSSRDGVASGTCADGYGVCCIITATCGSTTSENCTYLSQSASTTPSTDEGSTGCSYKICPRDTSISRIRLDLTTFQIGQPGQAESAAGVQTTGNGILNTATSSVGACNTDRFTITGSTSSKVPTICGNNDGQHMIVDTDGTSCVTASFSFGAATTTRSYTIHVIQYEKGNEMAGGENCLQFFTGMTGTVKTFNWIDLTPASVHLQNQNYNVCVRRLADQCVICWAPSTIGSNVTPAVGSFGLSNGGSTSAAGAAAAGSLSGVGTNACTDDYVYIPGGRDTAINALAAAVVTAASNDRFCGRRFGTVTAMGADAMVCTRVRPFKMTVVTNSGEVSGAAATVAVLMQALNEGSVDAVANPLPAPLGTQGFSLDFTQSAC